MYRTNNLRNSIYLFGQFTVFVEVLCSGQIKIGKKQLLIAYIPAIERHSMAFLKCGACEHKPRFNRSPFPSPPSLNAPEISLFKRVAPILEPDRLACILALKGWPDWSPTARVQRGPSEARALRGGRGPKGHTPPPPPRQGAR